MNATLVSLRKTMRGHTGVKIDLDETDEAILQTLFSDGNVTELLDFFEEESVRGLIEKLGLELPESLEREPEIDDEEEEEEAGRGEPEEVSFVP